MRIRIITLIFALVVLITGAQPVYAATSVGDIDKELICQCGCLMVANSCECQMATQFREDIAMMLDEGKSKGEILDHYVDLYGEIVLATPTKKGFNLTVWLTPFAALIAGGLSLVFLLRKWTSRDEAASVCTNPESDEIRAETEVLRKRFDEELAQFIDEENR